MPRGAHSLAMSAGGDEGPDAAEVGYLRAALAAAQAARDFLAWMEGAAEKLAPGRSEGLAAEARDLLLPAVARARAALDAAPPPDDLAPYASRLAEAFGHVERACALFAGYPEAPPPARIAVILQSLHESARAQDGFYALRRAAPPFADFWLLPGTTRPDRAARPAGDAGPATGVVHVGAGGDHGGFALYVPEDYDGDAEWPLVVALHGGSGNGPDFLWTWLREAKSRDYVLVAPSSVGSTWGPREDHGLLQIVAWLAAHYRIDRRRILLTGLSDGATFGLLYGLSHPDVYRAIAPLCGVLHPANEPLGNLVRARGVPIYL